LVFINILAFVVGLEITKLIEKICKNMDRRKTDKFFKNLQIFGAGSMAFMHGAQDGQKFIGVFLLAVALLSGDTNMQEFSIPVWLMLYCSIIMTTGALIGGRKIIKTIGLKMAKLEKYQGAAADISSSICLVIASILGMPVSTTHTKNTSVVGVGTARGVSKVNWSIVKKMVWAWIFTFPGCGILGYMMTFIFTKLA